jgi:acetyl-CoA carboxylase biotin carboxyl carrier protein
MSDDKAVESAMRVDSDLIRQLADLLAEKDLSEIEVGDGDRRVVVKRKVSAAAAAAPVVQAATPAPAVAAPAAEASPASNPGAVKSPMVGTVYLSGEPGGTPFVAAGSSVKEGDTLVIIEAMKVMNPIPSPRSGVVKQVLIENGQPVEYEQPLAIIE